MQRRYTEAQRARIREALWAYKSQFRRYGYDVMANDIADATGADRNFVYWTKLRNFMNDKNWVDDLLVEHCLAFLAEVSSQGNLDTEDLWLIPDLKLQIPWQLAHITRVATFDVYGRSGEAERAPEDIADDPRPWTELSRLHVEPPSAPGSPALVEETPLEEYRTNHKWGDRHYTRETGDLCSFKPNQYDICLGTMTNGRCYFVGVTSSEPLVLTGNAVWPYYARDSDGALMQFEADKTHFDVQVRLQRAE
jgi:hypothetical protein